MAFEVVDDTAPAEWLTARPDDAEVAIWFGPEGFEAHARVLQLPDPEHHHQSEDDIDDAVLDAMPTDVALVTDTVGVLRRFTATPDDFVFLLWTGWPYRPALPPTPVVDLGGIRDYAVAHGGVDDWVAWIAASTDGHGRGFAPGLLWPADRAWCVAVDVDGHFAGVGASEEAITALLAVGGLDVVRAARSVPSLLWG